jgi:hypothetical protein
MELDFAGEVIHWRGPAPFRFVAVPEVEATALRAASPLVSYGWGCIPVTARVGRTTFTTSLFPKDGGYLVPIKMAVQRAEHVDVGDVVRVSLLVEV